LDESFRDAHAVDAVLKPESIQYAMPRLAEAEPKAVKCNERRQRPAGRHRPKSALTAATCSGRRAFRRADEYDEEVGGEKIGNHRVQPCRSACDQLEADAARQQASAPRLFDEPGEIAPHP
jgi:hypothetical protein